MLSHAGHKPDKTESICKGQAEAQAEVRDQGKRDLSLHLHDAQCWHQDSSR